MGRIQQTGNPWTTIGENMRKHLPIAILGTVFTGVLLVGAASTNQLPPPLMVDRDDVAVILIDVQPFFVDIMSGSKEPTLQRLEQLLVLADFAEIPLIATFEHDPETNGWLPQRLEKVFPEHAERFVKRTFCLCREPEIRARLEKLGVSQIVVAGAETDVCVLQSVLGLIEMGFQVFVLEDCLFTNESHPGPALKRMYQAGAIPSTYKTFFHELTQTVDREDAPAAWKERLPDFAERLKSPYALVPWEPRL
jgi:nicotinamidase-related amidase